MYRPAQFQNLGKEEAVAEPLEGDTGSVEINVEGTTYRANYRVAGNVVTLDSAFGSKSMPAGQHMPDDVARMLLRELINLETRQLD